MARPPRLPFLTAALFAIAAVAVLVVTGSFYTIDQGELGVVLRLGKVDHVAGPGFNVKVPFVDSIVRVSVRTEKLLYDNLPSYSKDVQEAQIRISVNYRVNPANVADLYARYGTRYVDRAISPVVPERLKEVFGQFQAATVTADRVRLGQDVEEAIRTGVPQDLIIIESSQIENIDFSDAYETAIEAAAQAEAEVRKSRNQLERERIEAEKVIVQAQARAESVRQAAQAEADAIRLRGESEALAIKAKGDALRQNPELVTLIAAEKWNGELPTTQVPGAALPFITIPQKAASGG
ncbi:MAG: prohibitin family protein [Alphaproteobacteria bacterium]|nr:prohibitin family protein [Alphaproteobacteria bacterium]